MPPKKRARNSIPIATRQQIFAFKDSGQSQRQISERLGVTRGVVRYSLRNWESYEANSSDRKRMRACKWSRLESRLVKWIETMQMFHKEPVSQAAIVHKSLMLAERMGIEDFKGSNGWIEKFIRRNSIGHSVCLHGEAASSQAEQFVAEIDEIREKLKGFKPSNIYNQDEIGLFYRMKWKRTYLTKSEDCRTVRGRKLDKARVTLFSAANSTGTDILPLVMIGKPKMPRCWDILQGIGMQLTNLICSSITVRQMLG